MVRVGVRDRVRARAWLLPRSHPSQCWLHRSDVHIAVKDVRVRVHNAGKD